MANHDQPESNEITGQLNWEELPVFKEEDETDGNQDGVYVLVEKPTPRAKTVRCKVGRSGDTKKRRQDLQTGNSRELRIAAEYPVPRGSGAAAEKAAQDVARARYKHIQLEWFEVPNDKIDQFEQDIQKATKKATQTYM